MDSYLSPESRRCLGMQLSNTASSVENEHSLGLHSCGCLRMGGCDDAESASSKVVTKGQADIAACITLHNLPHIYYYITLMALLDRVQVEDPQTTKVVQVADQTYAVGEGPLQPSTV